MNNKQEYFGENARWIVCVNYFGIFDETRTICSCNSLYDAVFIIDGLVSSLSGRPIRFYAEKIADDFITECDSVLTNDFLTGETNDFNIYLEGISCLRCDE